MCMQREKNVLLKPCDHLVMCSECATSVKECPLCREDVKERVRVEKCALCTIRPCDRLLKPCGHMGTCEQCSRTVKTCPKCKSDIKQSIPLDQLCTVDYDSAFGNHSDGENLIHKLNQLNFVKEKVCFFFFFFINPMFLNAYTYYYTNIWFCVLGIVSDMLF